MFARTLRRLGAILLLLLFIFLSAKLVIRTLPGDPVDAILAETGANIDPNVLRQSLGLDRPFIPATLSQLGALVRSFDWGESLVLKQKIGPLLLERSRASIVLALTSLTLALLFSFTFSFVTELPHRFSKTLRRSLRTTSAISVALPTAWIGPILGFLLAVKFRLFSLTGGLALPAVTLALSLSGFWLRAFHETLIHELRSDVVRTARAKGLGELKTVWKHAFLPAAGPLIAFLGSQVGALFAGAVITETIFDRPGLGSLLVEGIFRRDYPLIEAVLIVTSAYILIGNLLGDLLQEWSQPKLRMREDLG